jgi:hypothetical protein
MPKKEQIKKETPTIVSSKKEEDEWESF